MTSQNKMPADADPAIDNALIDEANAGQKNKSSFWVDFGPLLIFFIVFHYFRRSQPDEALFIAAAIFAVAAVIAMAVAWIIYRSISGILIFSTLVIVGTTGLAFVFDNKVFLYMRPTVINSLFGVGLITGVFMNKNVLKLLIGEAFSLPDKAWNTLAIRWACLFFLIAIMNEFVWRTQTERFWVDFKTFVPMTITIIFTLFQIPFIKRHGGFDHLMKDTSE